MLALIRKLNPKVVCNQIPNLCQSLVKFSNTIPTNVNIDTSKKKLQYFISPPPCAVTVNPYFISRRYKKSKAKRAKNEEDSDSDNDLTEWTAGDKDLNKIAKVQSINTTSLRLDQVIKSALNISRNKIEVLFYESKIRKNGKVVVKKSASIAIGDEIDVIKGISPINPEHLIVSRVEILDLKAKTESISIIFRKQKALTIENYETPWTPIATETS